MIDFNIYAPQNFAQHFPSGIVVTAWITNPQPKFISLNKANLIHIMNEMYAPILFLDDVGKEIAHQYYGSELTCREFRDFKQVEPTDFQFRIIYQVDTHQILRQLLLDPDLESYMLGAFYNICPPLTSYEQTEKLFKLGAKYNLPWEIIGLPKEVTKQLDTEGAKIAESAVIGYLADTQKEFNFPGINGTFYWTRDGLSVNIRGVNNKLKNAASSAMSQDIDLKRTGYAEVLTDLMFSGHLRTGELIPLYALKQARRESRP